MKESEIRANWFAALKRNEEWGSSTIHWSFSSQDLLVLCCLHEAGFFQQEIEDLLEDCNFHTENGLMSEGKYDECRKLISNDMKEV